MWNIRDALTSAPLKCKANPALASPSRVHGDWIQFWTTDGLHGETPFDAVELGEGCARDEGTQGFGLIEIGISGDPAKCHTVYTFRDLGRVELELENGGRQFWLG